MMRSRSPSISASPSTTLATAEHVCHCGRRFLRKGHLQRHKAVHEEPTFVCRICQRSFTRNDLLRRHVARHDVVATSVTRRRQACDACRANKTKCDGSEGARCTLCVQRDADCSFRGAQPADQDDGSAVVTAQLQPQPQPQLGSEIITEDPEQASTNEPSDTPRPSEDVGNLLFTNDVPHSEPSLGTTRVNRILDCIKSSANLFETPLASPPPDVEAWYISCFQAYWQQFHDHWSLLHQPTISLDSDPLALTAAVILIGYWLSEPHDISDVLSEARNLLIEKCFQELSRPSLDLDEDAPWKIEVYQAVLLSILLAFYGGNKQIIARAGLLFSLLIATMRQVGIFSTERAEYQERTHFAGTFLPFVLGNREKHRRLVLLSLKIDTYLFLVYGHAPRIQPEELDVALPSTFAIWNASPLDMFYARLGQEPFDRANKKLSQISHDLDSLKSSELLIEDVQAGLCSMASALWRLTLIRRSSDAESTEPKALRSQQLENFEYQLEKFAHLCKTQSAATEPVGFPLRAYFGQETELCSPVLTRVRWLIHETMILHSFMSLYLYANMQILGFPDERKKNTVAELSTPNSHEDEDKAVLKWAHSLDSRKALLASLAILEARERLFGQEDTKRKSVDTLADAALSKGALVCRVWSLAMNGTCDCRRTLKDANTPNSSALSDSWPILSIDGSFCVCMAEGWNKRFTAMGAR